MQKNLPQKVHDSIKEHLRQKHWRRIVTAMACAVVFCTTYALILPAVTMTGETYCGKEEHTHTQEECYEHVLICGYDENEPETETTEPTSAHTHTDECYETESVLVCGEESSAGHTHDESCYDEEGNLTCDQTETTGHTHDESCYREERTLICGQEETGGTVPVSGHVHTDACYEDKLVCQLDEHEHTLICYSNPEADVESAAVWERTLPQNLGDNWAENVVAVANSQLGYAESTANYTVLDDGVTTKGYTRYGAWYGMPYDDWCAMFASFCLHYAGVPQTSVPYASGCIYWVEQLQSADLYESAAECYPEPGFLVFFDTDDDGSADHVGIVTEIAEDGETIKTVEGNIGGAVVQRSYSEGNSTILGYCVLPENPNAQENGSNNSNAADNALPADNTQTNSGEDSIAVGETKTLSVGAGEIVGLKFVPEYTHKYKFRSTSGGGTRVSLCSADGRVLSGTNTPSGDGGAYYELKSGQTYYCKIGWYDTTKTGEITVCLELWTHDYSEGVVCACGAQAATSGTFGENLSWSFDEETGVLTITGSGAMPSAGSNSQVPWSHLSKLIRSVNIKEGVTSICGYAFYGCTALETLEFPNTLNALGNYAFNDCRALKKADLSQTTVTNINYCAFGSCAALETVKFPDTLATISDRAFENCGELQEIKLSESLTEIGGSAFSGCSSLTSVDLSQTAVTAIGSSTFNGCGSLTTVMFPDELTTIDRYAFSNCTSLEKVDLSGTGVTSIGNNAFASCSKLETVLLPETLSDLGNFVFSSCSSLAAIDLSNTKIATLKTCTFQYCTALKNVKFPVSLTTLEGTVLSGCTSLPSLTIPKTVTSVGSSILMNCRSLTELRLEAPEVSFNATQSKTNGSFHVTVADTVNVLSADTMTALNNMGCASISFEGPNYLTVGSWQADFLPDCLIGRSAGEYFVDAQGVLYRIDSETNTASVFYCPAGIENYTVLKELPALEGKESTIPVTGVDSFAFADAADLTELCFETPETITTLAERAFGGATKLEKINGKTSAAEVLATFTNSKLQTGSLLFWQTKIGDKTAAPSKDALTVEKNHLTLTVSTEQSTRMDPAQMEDGTYLYYTGETAQTTVTVSADSAAVDGDETVVRVYFQFDSKNGKINYSPGTYTVVSDSTKNQYTMTVVQTDLPNCYYVELERPEQGDTISFRLESSYPSPTSGGGDAALWCGILTEKEKETLGSGVLPIKNHQSLNWSTKPDTFPVTKSESSTGSSKLVGNGEDSAYISGLTYAIKMSRTGDTLEGMGKDHMSSVDFVDVLTLPDGVTLADDVKESIQNGTVQIKATNNYSDGYGYIFRTAEGRTFLTITPNNNSTNYQYLQNGSVKLDDDSNLVVHWSFRNAELNTEMSDMTFTYQVADNTLVVKEPKAGVTYAVHNAVTATEHFMYSADQLQKDQCSVQVKEASSSLEIDKTLTRYAQYYGEQRVYCITASNPGALPYEGLAYITDDLPTPFYMRPTDLANTFAEDTEHQLTVTITDATFCKQETVQSIMGIDGSTGTTDPQNSGSGTTHSGMSNTDPDYQNTGTITISWGIDGKLQISTGDSTISCAAEEDAIKSALQSLGFVVTAKTQYCLSWDLRNADGTVPSLPGGGKIVKNVYCANKDTFMLLDNDSKYRHPTEREYNSNYAYGRNTDKKSIGYDYTGYFRYREFELSKNWYMDGKTIDEETTIRRGDILDYSLTVDHKGSAQYDALPLVDHMSGAQVLLVPVKKNECADWTNSLQTVTDNGTEYYILSNPGTYRNVWVNETQLADTVEVTQSGSSLDTLIKWYFVNYTGTRTDTVSYRAYVCPDKTALTYSLNNECWLSDRESHRLYAPLPGWNGVSFSFDKVIVDNVGDTGEGYRSSDVNEGQTVVYRLSLSSPTDQDGNPQTMTITGKDMYDALPLSMDGYRWSTENVRITYGKGESCQVTNGEHWNVEVPDAGDQQYLKWSADFSITFTGTAYVYVELTFPSDTKWQEYAVKYGTTTLTNTFHVLSAQRSVTHQVSIAAKVYLQKGVFDTGYFYGSSNSQPYRSDMSMTEDRLYYQNNDVKIRAVKYYVALYNEGPTNLYLTDMQDLLPKGFTYAGGGTYAGTTKFTTTTETGTNSTQILKANGAAASKKVAQVTSVAQTTENGRQIVTFQFSQPSGTSSYNISYDEDRGMCYLKPGECITFKYICKTNESEDTDDAALNTVTMPYYDFNGGGVVVDNQCVVTGPSSNMYTPNDGGCDVMDNGQVASLGFIGETDDTQWLTSDVTVIRGGIKPGITKTLTSKTSTAGTTELNPVSANPQDTLNWTITTENDGTNSIVDYVLTDRMQSPYMFTGEVSYTIYNAPNDTNKVAFCTAGYLFKIAKGSDDMQLNVTTNSGKAVNVTIGGESVTLSCNWYYSANSSNYGSYGTVNIQLSITKDKDENAVMSLRFPDATMAIPEGGNSKLTLSTSNTSDILQNKQFINTCFVTPLTQTWDNTTNKGNITTLDTPYGEGEMPTVRNSAPVTTSYGYVTGSSKRVTEVGNDSNTAACTDEPNYIVLPDAEKLFRYTITVDNSTPKAMDMLVLIDGLPEVGDHTAFLTSDPRFSEFKVSLAENPDFSVTVTAKDGTVTTLPADSYTIEYSTKTAFDSNDWQGTSTWNTDVGDARSIRLTVMDSTGTLIPAGSTISLSFICKIDGNVQPGQVAWNSFGYHYSLAGDPAELEAAPLKVGVKIPSIPELRKQVVDHSGQVRTVEKDTAFQFLVYQGAALSGSYTTKEELVAALGDTPYAEYTVTVKAGQSLSDSIRLQTDKWTWTNGEKYTIVELPCGGEYSFKRFLNSVNSTYTLTYTQAQTQIITCENTALRWSIDLTKENTSHTVLSGAVFALYSPNSSDQLSTVPEEYADLNIGLTADNGGKTWYLKAVKTTSEDGKLNWSDLLEEQYYLLEVKAPDGYNLNSPAGQILRQDKETQGIYSVTVVNRSGSSLPETGGIGTHLYTLGGLLLLLGAATILLYHLGRRRKGDKTST